MDVRMFTVGMVAENTYILRRDGSDRALIVDPGDEAPKLLGAIEELGVRLDGILLTHTHFDHVGAVAPVARATGAEVWVPEFESGRAGGHQQLCALARLRPVRGLRGRAHRVRRRAARARRLRHRRDLHSRPQPGSRDATRFPTEGAVFSGDVLFQGSVGRTDLPGGHWPTLLESIRGLVEALPPETTVYPGHMGVTTLGAERASNPFLAELAR